MGELLRNFKSRTDELESYLSFLEAIEEQVKLGAPTIGGSKITVQQQRILYSGIYLQCYNLMEATITLCVESLTKAAAKKKVTAGQLNSTLLKEWIRFVARTHTEMSFDKRLNAAVTLCDHLIKNVPLEKTGFEIEKGGGGNWDDLAIESICERLGLKLKLNAKLVTEIKRKFRDDIGMLVYIKIVRNKLAHGAISFEECGTSETVVELRRVVEHTTNYLRALVRFFESAIKKELFLSSSTGQTI